MNNWQCACGLKQIWSDDLPIVAPCFGCETCGTGYSSAPGYHAPLEPHEWVPQDIGPRICARCNTLEVKP